MTNQQAALWVRNFWADRMRLGNAPDLPASVTIEQFQRASMELANRISPPAATPGNRISQELAS